MTEHLFDVKATRAAVAAAPRLVARLEGRGLLQRVPDPHDGRGSLAALTRAGLVAFRRAQVLHHATVRELFVGRLTTRELRRLADLYEKAMPGVSRSDDWLPFPAADRLPTRAGPAAERR